MQGEAVSNIQESAQTPTVQEESEEEEVWMRLGLSTVSTLDLANWQTANSCSGWVFYSLLLLGLSGLHPCVPPVSLVEIREPAVWSYYKKDLRINDSDSAGGFLL